MYGASRIFSVDIVSILILKIQNLRKIGLVFHSRVNGGWLNSSTTMKWVSLPSSTLYVVLIDTPKSLKMLFLKDILAAERL